MTSFYAQPRDQCLGTSLQNLLNQEKWASFDVAVAWVRRSGTKHLGSSMSVFLTRGGSSRFIVGVDIENTSEEGLSDLLALRVFGRLEIFVYHNESAPVFHPKVYLLTNRDDAHLIVGSNNLTEAGLFTNTEAGLQIETPVRDPLIQTVRDSLDAWIDPSTGLARPLDENLLRELVDAGYVLSEEVLRQRRRLTRAATKQVREVARQRYFAAAPVTAPPAPAWPIERTRIPRPGGAGRGPIASGGRRPIQTEPEQETGGQVLVVAAPKSRGGWRQLQLNLDVMERYFQIPSISGERITLRHRLPTGQLDTAEARRIIFSNTNKNVKVEVGGAVGVSYPTNGYPIVIFRRLSAREFEYVIRTPGDVGHQPIADMLNSATDTIGRGMPRVIRSVDEIRALWPEYPSPVRV